MILQAAILTKEGALITLPRPARHPDLILAAQVKNISLEGARQGFLCRDSGNSLFFAHRTLAFEIARDHEQLLPYPEGGRVEGVLYSEDVW